MEPLTTLLPIPKLALHFFNTESRAKEEFKPKEAHAVKMYTCGPTVYHYVHIGNLRTFVFEDLLRRTLKFFGYNVIQAMNITDIDDKTIRGASQKGMKLEEFTTPFAQAFFVDLQTLGIEKVEFYPYATNYINQMIDFIQKLLDKGIAYKSHDKSIYFSIAKFPRYGRLSHLKLDELKVGASEGIQHDEYEKETVSDFVLWKAYDKDRDGPFFWKSPFGEGRPGWHLECSTMAMELLGETLDIHVGGVDNMFPHHENEIAQSECCSGKPFVRYWLHCEHLLVNHKKMSKSLGNFYTLRDLQEKGFSGMEVRFLLLQAHYRTQLNFTFEGLEGARHSLARLNAFGTRMQEMASSDGNSSPKCRQTLQAALTQFSEGLANDLNSSVAFAALFDLMHAINVQAEEKTLTPRDAFEVLYILKEMNRVLGLFTFEQAEAPPALLDLVKKRQEARAQKDFKTADACRAQIESSGYTLEDTPKGPRLIKK